MTRHEAVVEAAGLIGAIRRSEEPATLFTRALTRLVGTGLLETEEVEEIEAYIRVAERMNNRDFAEDMAETFLDLIKGLEPGAALLH